MADRDYDRNRTGRDRNYYYDRDYYGRNYYGGNYYDYDRDYYGRNYSYNRRYDTDYDYESDYYEYDYWRSGPYAGVGPRNYQRSDDRIEEDVNDRLTWHGNLDASDIEVSVNDGVVTLSGTVDNRQDKRMAEDVVESVSGVWDVHNNLTLRERNRWTSSSRMGQTPRGQFREGMEVVGRDSNNVGQVKKVRGNDFLVDRPMARDVYVPFSAASIEGGRVRLHVQADEVDNQGWEMPELMEETS